jgi:RNA polymerase sigma-70 factor (sigma-E family)
VATHDDAFVEFVHARSPALLRVATLLARGDRDAGEDLLQSALVRAYSSWGRIRTPEATESYVRKILVRTAISDRRHKYRQREVATAEPPEGPDNSTRGDVEVRLDLWQRLQNLPSRQRAVIVLRYYEDLHEAEIADILGCSRGAVKSHAARALRALRVSLLPDAPSAVLARPESRNSDERL